MDDGIEAELKALRKEIATFNAHRFVRVQNSLPRMVLQSFARGLAVGLGTVVGASVLVSVLLYFLSQIDFLPIIGDWAQDIAGEIRASTGSGGDGDAPPAD